jgi:APA family basic amino acid/polyamine antiporter
MRNPVRDLPRSLLAGTGIVVAIYVLVNIAYLRALGLEGLAGSTTPAADAVGGVLGAGGGRFVAAAIAISTFGFLDLAVLAPTRVYYAMAADGTFFKGLARLHPRFQTPALAIVLQSSWAIVLALTGEYGDLLDTVVFADWIFFGLTVAGLFVLRRRLPRSPFRTPLYPWIPGCFVLVAASVVFSTIYAQPVRSSVGAGLLLLGVPVFYFFTRWSSRR